MVRASLLRRPTGFCRGLKLRCSVQIGARSRQGHDLAPVLAVVELLSAPHEKCPSHGFNLLMRARDGDGREVEAMELQCVTYDLHPLRDALAAQGGREKFELELLFQPWLFPGLEYREEAAA